ncbi:hypothetical protein SYN60AY4M2_10865 [Synechococcus sp. 60AY4M2]|nr:hypothetical protein SYN65AY6A5_00505 [Synechococcus sp. 65AY6A5]PIK96505.1 hypothetical protein SYN60AY4M2_10865 [Synechococcus sp. 60AY4M2]PIK99104.1 hypothetical protein SYN63AY4M1_08270 [Synechococcus sp. 63AY4M1]PIL02453.1 hypothetical protein SYN65AY640_05810 [Synechococcus sp. 65AY640]
MAAAAQLQKGFIFLQAMSTTLNGQLLILLLIYLSSGANCGLWKVTL